MTTVSPATTSGHQLWQQVLVRLSEKISRMEFYTWFQKVHVRHLQGHTVVLGCPTEMNRNWLENKYYALLLKNIQAVMPEIRELQFTVDLTLADKAQNLPTVFEKPSTRKIPRQPEVRVGAKEDGLQSRVIQPKFTLQNFIVGEENRLAHSACLAVAECADANRRKYNPLFVYGGVGLGKTHLLQGTANEILHRNSDSLIIYITAERFTNEIVKAIRERKAEEFRKKYRRADVFILDDVQFLEGKEQTQNELFNTFNDLFDHNRQIIFSSDRPPSELAGISDRLRSRMGWGLAVDVQMPNVETRMAIVQEKSSERGLLLAEDVQEFIAVNTRRSLRELENILNQIQAELELSGVSPTVQSTARIFRKLNPHDDFTIGEPGRMSLAKSPDDIITLVSEYFQVPATELLGCTRKQEVVFPRQVAWLLCKEVLRMSFENIGETFGGKNHTTIMHGVKKIEQMKATDSAVARHIVALKKDLGAR